MLFAAFADEFRQCLKGFIRLLLGQVWKVHVGVGKLEEAQRGMPSFDPFISRHTTTDQNLAQPRLPDSSPQALQPGTTRFGVFAVLDPEIVPAMNFEYEL